MIKDTTPIVLEDADLDQIQGGSKVDEFLQINGVDGESRAHVPADTFSLNYEEIKGRY